MRLRRLQFMGARLDKAPIPDFGTHLKKPGHAGSTGWQL
jgi:hypothetical protein